jgi:predicted transcriptional regulator
LTNRYGINTENEDNEVYEAAKEGFEAWGTTKLLERYEHLKRVVLRNIPELWNGLEFAISVKTILNMKGNTLPFPGILLGPSGEAKTVIIRMFRGYKHTFYTDNFSPKSFVSHNSTVSKDKLRDIDLLPKLKDKFFLVSELAPIFAAKDDDLLQMLGILTRVADGHGYESDSGSQGHRGYNERINFVWLGASVDIPPKVYRILSTLGPKLYFFRISSSDKNEDYYYDTKNEDFEEKEQEIRIALFEYLVYFDMNPEATFDEVEDEDSDNDLPKIFLEPENDEELAYRIIIRLAKLLARLRATVPTWETRDTQGSEYAYSLAKVENPKRAIKQLSNLARGHALSKGVKYITMDDIPLVINTALSTASTERVRIFEILIANKGTLTTSQICDFLNTSKPTALRTMTELKATGLVEMSETRTNDGYNMTHTIKLKQEFDWFLSDEFQELKEGKTSKEKYPMSTPQTTVSIIHGSSNDNSNGRGIGSFSLHPPDKVIERFSNGKYTCKYCKIVGYDLKYENEDLLEEHVVQKHVGWTAYPGESDLEKFKAGYENKKESNKE